ncbi:hypothetical protein F4860DRAFT_529115 [Xylaria cubensis]|nr:hypothetical protein F4860DRAFT_529115 [Xylaria cubensis]
MDDYEYDRLMDGYPPFPPSNNEDNPPATIDPAMLQTSAHDFEYHFEQQQEPIWVDQSWPVQLLGSNLEFDIGHPTHLERHVQNNTKQLQLDLHPCAECPTYQGKNGFKRKDHLVQHLRVFHKWDDDQLATLTSAGQNSRLKIPTCHFPECDYYRDPSFKDMGIREQAKNRPFDKQSHYTDHMKREHDWSPYPCKVVGCSKVNGAGFFSITALEKHYKGKHPGSAIPAPKVDDQATETVRCDDCGKNVRRGYFTQHQRLVRHGEVECLYCHDRIGSSTMRSHQLRHCKAEVGKLHVAFAMDAWSIDMYGSIEETVLRETEGASNAQSGQTCPMGFTASAVAVAVISSETIILATSGLGRT